MAKKIRTKTSMVGFLKILNRIIKVMRFKTLKPLVGLTESMAYAPFSAKLLAIAK